MHALHERLPRHKVLSFIESPELIKKFLKHLGLWEMKARRLSENGYFSQSPRQAEIIILEILHVFLWL